MNRENSRPTRAVYEDVAFELGRSKEGDGGIGRFRKRAVGGRCTLVPIGVFQEREGDDQLVNSILGINFWGGGPD